MCAHQGSASTLRLWTLHPQHHRPFYPNDDSLHSTSTLPSSQESGILLLQTKTVLSIYTPTRRSLPILSHPDLVRAQAGINPWPPAHPIYLMLCKAWF